MMKTTTFITDQHPMAPLVAVIDADGNIVKKVKSYNTETCEAEVYATDENGKVITDWNNEANQTIFPAYPGQPANEYGKHIRIEKKILKGSKLVFRDITERKEEGTSIEEIAGVTNEQMDLINVNAYRRALMFLESKDGIGKIYDEIDALSKKYNLGWTEARTEADDSAETYKRKLVPSLDQVILMNRLYNDTFDVPIEDLETAIKAKMAEIYETGMKVTEENSDMPGYERRSMSVETILREGIQMGIKSKLGLYDLTMSQEAQLMTVTDRRQYAVNIYYPSGTVKHNDEAILLDIEFTPEDTAETMYKQITEAAMAKQFPGDLKFDPTAYRFDIIRL